MSSIDKKPHAVCIPYPAQSHIKGMLKLAKLLHSKGIHITFVNTEFNHNRFINSGGPNSLTGLPDFKFESIPDGLPPSDVNTNQDHADVCQNIRNTGLAPFLGVLKKLGHDASSNVGPSVTCIVSDTFMTLITIDAAKQLGIPILLLWTLAACGVLSCYQLHIFKEKGVILPQIDESYLTNGYLDTEIDDIPCMKGVRLRDFIRFPRRLDPNNSFFNFCMESAERATKASVNIVQTFEELEPDLVSYLSSLFYHVYTIGPTQLLLNQIPQKDRLDFIGYSLLKEEPLCLEWLNSKEPNAVIYVNFGSMVVMPSEKIMEFGWGLANSNQYFLWIIRSDMVEGESAILPPEFLEVTKERGFIASWCPQEQVLNHPSIGGFFTHGGWNSIIESLSAGVPMICFPFFADQLMNCRYMCTEWEVGMEINSDLNKDEVERLVRELMEGEKGKKMKNKALGWKEIAEKATSAGGSSSTNESYLTNGYLDTIVDWIPNAQNIRFKDLPSFVRTTNPEETIFKFTVEATQRSTRASANILHSFEELEKDVVSFLSSILPQLYTIGPLELLLHQISDQIHVKSNGYSLWKEEPRCIKWLNSKEPNSVIYVNFGSIAVMSPDKMAEFSLGLANSEQYFLWIIRPDLIEGESGILPSKFLEDWSTMVLHRLSKSKLGGLQSAE
ncbi:hypothetical protein LguiB_004240 [Lonicera macranthoides]